MLTRRLTTALCVSSLAALALAFFFVAQPPGFAATTCPPGFHAHDDCPGVCVTNKHPEPYWEVELRQREWISARSAPFDTTAPGAYANALGEREQVKKNAGKVKGVGGTWPPYGSGPLISNGDLYPATNDLGRPRSPAASTTSPTTPPTTGCSPPRGPAASGFRRTWAIVDVDRRDPAQPGHGRGRLGAAAQRPSRPHSGAQRRSRARVLHLHGLRRVLSDISAVPWTSRRASQWRPGIRARSPSG